MSRILLPGLLRTHPLHRSEQFGMVTQFSQFLSSRSSESFCLVNPLEDDKLDSAIAVLEENADAKIVKGEN